MQRLIDDARGIFRAAVQSVQAYGLISDLKLDDLVQRPISEYDNIYVIGMGKAAMAMASTIEHDVGLPVTDGCVVVPTGYPETLPFPTQNAQKNQCVRSGASRSGFIK